MAWSSTVPGTLAALVSLFSAAPALAGVTVIDGQALPDTSALQAVFVGGIPGDATGLAADGAVTPEGLAGTPDREQYAVHCAAQVLNGAGDIAAARVAAYALMAACGAAIAADHTLAKTVLRASLGASSLHQAQISTGALVTVAFDIAVDAFTGR